MPSLRTYSWESRSHSLQDAISYFTYFPNAVIVNLRLLKHVAKYYGFPVSVDLKNKICPVSLDNSISKELLWNWIRLLELLRTLLIIYTLALCLVNDRYFEPLFFPIHLGMAIGFPMSLYTAAYLTPKYIGEFVSVWNVIWRYSPAVEKFKVQHLFIYIFPTATCTVVALISFALALNPQFLPHFQFVVHWARQEGYLIDGPLYIFLRITAFSIDFVTLNFCAASCCAVVISQVMFLEVWYDAIDRLVSRPLTRRHLNLELIETAWNQFHKLYVSLRLFNVCNAGSLFALKVGIMSISISCLSGLFLFPENLFIVKIIMLYGGVMITLCYPALYYRAPSVAKRLEVVKRQMMKSGTVVTSANLQRRILAISTKGVWVGSFRTFERETLLLYLNFIVNQVVTIVLANK